MSGVDGIFKLGRVVSLLTPTIIAAFTLSRAHHNWNQSVETHFGVNLMKSSNVYLVFMDLIDNSVRFIRSLLIVGGAAIAILVMLKSCAPHPRIYGCDIGDWGCLVCRPWLSWCEFGGDVSAGYHLVVPKMDTNIVFGVIATCVGDSGGLPLWRHLVSTVPYNQIQQNLNHRES